MKPQKTPSTLSLLCSRSFVAACLGHFFLFCSFFMLLPVLPIYLTQELGANQTIAGLILSAYTLAALAIRPFTGRFVDSLPRRKVYLAAYAFFTIIFAGYILVHSAFGLGFLRFSHGLGFGILTIASTAIAIDTMPKHLIGSGIGIFGTTSALAMSIAPMFGLKILALADYQTLFISSLICCSCGLLLSTQVRPTTQEIAKTPQKFSWQTMVMPQGKKALIGLGANTFLYGIFINYLALFAKEKQLDGAPGTVYLLFSIGIIASRLFSGRMIDRGAIIKTVLTGKIILLVSFIPFIFTSSQLVFLITGMFIGLGYGFIIPGYQGLFNNLAPVTQRGFASSSFLTAFDLGIFLSLLCTGVIASFFSLKFAFAVGLTLVALSAIFFYYSIAPHYQDNKLQG